MTNSYNLNLLKNEMFSSLAYLHPPSKFLENLVFYLESWQIQTNKT